MSSCIRRSGMPVWRISSSAPNVEAARHAALRPKRAERRLPITAANSASGSVAAWSLSPLTPPRDRASGSPPADPRPPSPRRPPAPSRAAGARTRGRSSCTARPKPPNSRGSSRVRPLISSGNTSASDTLVNSQSRSRAKGSHASRVTIATAVQGMGSTGPEPPAHHALVATCQVRRGDPDRARTLAR